MEVYAFHQGLHLSTVLSRAKTYGNAFSFAGTEFTTGAGELVNGDGVTSVTLTSGGAPASATVGGSPYTITPSTDPDSGVDGNWIGYLNRPVSIQLNPRAHAT